MQNQSAALTDREKSMPLGNFANEADRYGAADEALFSGRRPAFFRTRRAGLCFRLVRQRR